MTDNAAKRAMRRSRSMMTRPNFSVRTDAQGGEIHSLIIYNEYCDNETQGLVEGTDFSSLPKLGQKTLDELWDDLQNVFDSQKMAALFDNSSEPQLLIDFRGYLREILPLSDLQRMTAYWPPVVPAENALQRAICLWLIKFIHYSSHPHRVVHWLGRAINPGDYSSMDNSILSALSLCKLKGKTKKSDKFYWALLDKDRRFTLSKIEDGSLVPFTPFRADGITVDKGVVSVFHGDQKAREFVPVDEGQALLWVRAMEPDHDPFPLMFCSIEKPLPNEFLCSFYEALTSSDLIVAKVLVSYEVTKVTAEGYPVMEALLDVFSHAGKVNQLLQVLVGYEMGKPELTNNSVLRVNCNLTNMFKVFFFRYGKDYYTNVVKPIIRYVDKIGDIGWANPSKADLNRAFSVVLSVLKIILESGPLVPPHLRHMASVLKELVTIRFNDKQATYNALSGFFLLRFVNGIIVDQRQFDPSFQPKDMCGVLVPFSQVMQYIFNLIPFYGKMEMMNVWNDRLIKHVFPKVMDWVMSIADYEENAVYEPPDESRLTGALELIISVVARSQKNFERIYRESAAVQREWTVGGWSFATFLASYFKQNENNRICQSIPDE